MQLVLIGGPPRSATYLHKLLDLCEKRGVRERVITTGWKPQAEASEVLASCDAAIIPLSPQSGLSAVALPDKAFEYLASGLPVISTRVPDLEEIFSDCMYFYDTREELTQILNQLLADPNRKCTPEYQIKKASKYDWRILSKTYERLIAQLVEGESGQQ